MSEKDQEKLNLNVSVISTKQNTIISIKGKTEETQVNGTLEIDYLKPDEFGSSNYRNTLHDVQVLFSKIFNN